MFVCYELAVGQKCYRDEIKGLIKNPVPSRRFFQLSGQPAFLVQPHQLPYVGLRNDGLTGTAHLRSPKRSVHRRAVVLETGAVRFLS
jgi:hypothetical protein